MPILVSASRLEKSFASRTLFRGLTFAVESGDRIGLIGPNGAGKTTLMRIMSGQSRPDGGELSFSRGLRVGFLEQTPEFRPGVTVYDAVLERAEDAHDPQTLQLAEAWMAKLDLNQGEVTPESLVERLSGGWRKRVALARELVKHPDLLLLDEPTNHLDLESILWLEEFLREEKFATITVTHDRLFLQRVANRIFDLDPRNPDGLLVINGDYLAYLEAKELLMHAQERREVVAKNTLRRETEWLRRGAIARQTKQQARIERAGELKDEVEELQTRNLNRRVAIDFSESERHPQKLIEAKKIGKSYAGVRLFADLDYVITPKTRLGLLGVNGCGKSTLIRALLGLEAPDEGEVVRAEKLEVAYFDQHRTTLDPKVTVLRTVCPEGDYVDYRGTFVFARSYLSRFLFRSEQLDMPVEKLSGGEQSRLRIAQLMLQKAHVLVLDEPTNDLDGETLNVLEESLQEFKGAVILVSHDRYFLDQVADDILAFAPVEKGEGNRLIRFAGYSQWENWFSEEGERRRQQLKRERQQKARTGSARNETGASADVASESAGSEVIAGSSGAADKPAKKRRLSYKEKLELEQMEGNILTAETRLKELETESQSPEVISNAARLTEIYAELAKLQERIDFLYQRWAELEQAAT